MKIKSGILKPLRVALGLALALTVAGCESLDGWNPFEQQKKPVPGTRQPVFPEGVPGVDYSSRLGQPSKPVTIDQLPPPSGGNAKPQQQQQ
ncbi:hypothetical protein V5F59_12635 [Xanthobacter autotrophicus DSM 431]|uniref:hypothetical protein n=1 Tax=Xanthobacter nonsaccharivorans TaxID=3119912 RepID=UPI0037266450